MSTAADYYPPSLLEDVEWHVLIEKLQSLALSHYAAEKLRNLPFHTDTNTIEEELRKVADFKAGMDVGLDIEWYRPHNPEKILEQLQISGYVLQQDQLRILYDLTRSAVATYALYQKTEWAGKGTFTQQYAPLKEAAPIAKRIAALIDEEGNIRPDASPTLLQLTREMESQTQQNDELFDTLRAQCAQKGWLVDIQHSYRQNMRVLAVKPMYRRNIPGLLVDKSESGNTLFIAPLPYLEGLNALRELQLAYKTEVRRLLREISSFLRRQIQELRPLFPSLVQLDVWRAKARLAKALRASLPEIADLGALELQNALHPLLFLKNQSEGKTTVPFSLRLDHERRVILISGPNAGGKTVLLKATCLIQLMCRAGLLPPVDAHSKIRIFKKLFAEIGNHQSIDDELSTFSAHAQHLRYILCHADADTLILIDEIGAGTDPEMGSALAEALVEALIDKKCMAIVTTHYPRLKLLAERFEAMTNASMAFDEDALKPTYRLVMGIPGRSYTFEIARQSGLPKVVIQRAQSFLGEEKVQLEEILRQWRRKLQDIHLKSRQLDVKAKQLDILRLQYEDLKHQLLIERKKLRMEKKQWEQYLLRQEKQQIQQLLKEKLSGLRREELQGRLDEIRQKIHRVEEQIDEAREILKANLKNASNVERGDAIVHVPTGIRGEVEDIQGDKILLIAGGMRFTVPRNEVQPIEEKLQKSNSAVEHSSSHDVADRKVAPSLDLRGMNKRDAEAVLHAYMDRALLSNLRSVRIIHGKGTGALRRIVEEVLRTYQQDIRTHYHPSAKEGGDGVTVVEFSL